MAVSELNVYVLEAVINLLPTFQQVPYSYQYAGSQEYKKQANLNSDDEWKVGTVWGWGGGGGGNI